MILNQNVLRVPLKIRALLKHYKLGLLFLSHKSFRYMLQSWGASDDTIAAATKFSNLILVDAERIILEKMPQKKVNYILLHEIAHGGCKKDTEKAAHACALEMADRFDIGINYKGVII